MRQVKYNPTVITLPAGWSDKVTQLNANLAAENDDKKRSDLIDKNNDLWKDIKSELAKIFYNKCWYMD